MSDLEPGHVGSPASTTIRQAWYSSSDPACDALEPVYLEAKVYLKSQLSESEHIGHFLSQSHSIASVEEAVREARALYKSKPASKAQKWLGMLASRIIHYGNIMDVLAQHHPEYVSLVWGTFKFLFVGVMNHEEKISQLSKACSRIADILPRTQLTLILYPTQGMKSAVAQLYASIMKFVREAIRWYKQGKVAHAWNSITKPWALSFEVFVQDIDEQARRVDDLSRDALKAEVREAHSEIREVRREIQETRLQIGKLEDLVKSEAQAALQVALTARNIQQSICLDVQNSRSRIRDVQLGQILSDPVFQRFPPSGACLEYCKNMRHRRAQRSKFVVPEVDQLQNWSSQASSSFLITNTRNPPVARDFMVDLIDLIRESKAPALWALRFENYWKMRLSKVDIIRMLVAQALQANPSALDDGDYPIAIMHLRAASGESDWLQILSRAVKGMPQVFVALDSDLLSHTTSGNRYQTTRWLESLAATMGNTAMKFIISSTGVDNRYVTTTWAEDIWTRIDLGDRATRGCNPERRARGQASARRRRIRRKRN